jgi:diketogulonate reductase-like aldo/keto reductase
MTLMQFKIPVIGLDTTGPLIGKSSKTNFTKIVDSGFEHVVLNITNKGFGRTITINPKKNLFVTYMMHLKCDDIDENNIKNLLVKTNKAINIQQPSMVVLHAGPNVFTDSRFQDKWYIFVDAVRSINPNIYIGFYGDDIITDDLRTIVSQGATPNAIMVDSYIINNAFLNYCHKNGIEVISMVAGRAKNIHRLSLFSKKYNAESYHIILRWIIQFQGVKIVIMDRDSADAIISHNYLQIHKFCLGPSEFSFIRKFMLSF